MEAGTRSRPPAGGQVSGWIAFAGVMMVILGALDVIWGLAAIVNDEIVVVGGHGAMILDITTWGWIQLIVGIVLGLVGLGLISGNEASRWADVFLIGLNSVLQVIWFPAAPLWAFLIIILDVVLIYQLIVNWGDSRAAR